MEIVPSLRDPIVIGGAVAIPLILFLLVSMYRKIRNVIAARVNCWFCNSNTKVPFAMVNSWTCPSCHQYNGFSKDGGYNKRIPAQWIESLNKPIRGCAYGKTSFGPNGLCAQCNLNQELKIFQLSSFVPTTEDNWAFDQQIVQEQKRLEKIYELCSPCQEFVRRKLRAGTEETREEDLMIGKLKIVENPLVVDPQGGERSRSVQDSDYFLGRAPTPVFSPLRPYNSSSPIYSPSPVYSFPSFSPSPLRRNAFFPLRHSELSFSFGGGASLQQHHSSQCQCQHQHQHHQNIRKTTFPPSFYDSGATGPLWTPVSTYNHIRDYKSSSVASIFGGSQKDLSFHDQDKYSNSRNFISPPRLSHYNNYSYTNSDFYTPKMVSRCSSQSSGFISGSLVSEPYFSTHNKSWETNTGTTSDISDSEEEDQQEIQEKRPTLSLKRKLVSNSPISPGSGVRKSKTGILALSLLFNAILLLMLASSDYFCFSGTELYQSFMEFLLFLLDIVENFLAPSSSIDNVNYQKLSLVPDLQLWNVNVTN